MMCRFILRYQFGKVIWATDCVFLVEEGSYANISCVVYIEYLSDLCVFSNFYFILSYFQFGIHTSKIEELTNLMKIKDEEIEELERKLSELQQNVKTMTHELEVKVEEIRKVRREGNINTRLVFKQLCISVGQC